MVQNPDYSPAGTFLAAGCDGATVCVDCGSFTTAPAGMDTSQHIAVSARSTVHKPRKVDISSFFALKAWKTMTDMATHGIAEGRADFWEAGTGCRTPVLIYSIYSFIIE